jgi:hypothetical protein
MWYRQNGIGKNRKMDENSSCIYRKIHYWLVELNLLSILYGNSKVFIQIFKMVYVCECIRGLIKFSLFKGNLFFEFE